MYSLEQQLSVMQLTGKDALVFINNQIINNFDHNSKQPHYSAICNPKGRIIFSLLMWQHDEIIFMAIDKSLSEEFKQYINMRRFRMDMKLTDANNYTPVVTDIDNDFVKDITLSASPDHKPLSSSNFWQIFFRSNLPWITKESSEQFIPQHLSLDQHQLIEYQKGCYPGQEIIARLHFIGRNKKQLALIQLNQQDNYKNGGQVTINDIKGQLCSPAVEIDNQLTAQIVKNIAVKPDLKD